MTDTVAVIPTYNNARTLEDVLKRTLSQGLDLIVVNDGSTDATPFILVRYPSVKVITHKRNRGKGAALKSAFILARKMGYAYAVTIDADGQHYPEDIPLLLAQKGERTLVVGSRDTRGKGSGATFANKLSNGTFALYSGISLPDTQTGFRLYPLNDLPSLSVMSARYEAELSLLLFSAWKGLRLVPVPVQVNYPEDRVSHFRPVRDFMRITALNTAGLFLALFYGWPRILLRTLRQ